jgi:hypothetical protein
MKRLKLIAAITALATMAPIVPAQGEQAAPAPWLVAQSATCELEGRRVPAGASYCREGRLWLCTASGTWSNTNKPC